MNMEIKQNPGFAPELLYGVPQISAFLDLGQQKTRRLLEEDPTLPCFRIGENGLWMAKTADLRAWLSGPCPKRRRKYVYED